MDNLTITTNNMKKDAKNFKRNYKVFATLIMFIVFGITSAFANFCDGYQAGYESGFCDGNEYGCYKPGPQTCGIPRGEEFNNYNGGFAEGFKAGLRAQ